jgi:hypothetical protein
MVVCGVYSWATDSNNAHYKKEDAQAASEQVNARFNTIPRSEWKRYINGSREPISKALALLDYDDDDEMVALGRINPDGSVTVDSSLEARQEFTQYANAKMSMLTGKSSFGTNAVSTARCYPYICSSFRADECVNSQLPR